MTISINSTTFTAKSNQPVLFIAFELADKEWKIAFSDGRPNPRLIQMPARDMDQLATVIERARERFELPNDCHMVSCYEAGRDGFWLHRKLVADGIENLVIDSASIEVNRRRRKAKTDRIDVRKLLIRLIRHHFGEPDVWSVVHVPNVEDEDARELHREIQIVQKEVNQHRRRIESLLIKHGVTMKINNNFPEHLKEIRLYDGSNLPQFLQGRLFREFERLQQAHKQKLELEGQRRKMIREPNTERLEQVVKLVQLRGIGEIGAWILVMEFFGWRQFQNRKQVGAAAGLVGTPYDSGNSEHEQGISKAGNKRVRSLMVELAWCWLRYQPNSHHAQWFNEKFGTGKRRRKVGIVALARRLLVDFWRYLEMGVVPAGASLKA